MKCTTLFISLLTLTCSSLVGWTDLTSVKLDTYLFKHNQFVDEGYVTPGQKAEFLNVLQQLPQTRKIMEIGFNAGHSAEFFLENTECELMVSFDINIHPYLKTGLDFITKKFGNRFAFVEGNSLNKVPEFAVHYPDEKFDLIFIDGNHTFGYCLSDIQNCSKLAHENTIVVIDDYVGDVKSAVDLCVLMRLISIKDCRFVHDDFLGDRIWIIANYLKFK